MITKPKIRVAVLQGGQSGEHEVSLLSASNVIRYLDRTRFSVTPVTIGKDGSWTCGEGTSVSSAALLFDPARPFDVIFPVVHGTLCEDGTLQGLLEQAGLPYVGCGVLSSSLAMDKDVTKRLALEAGMAVAPFVVLRLSSWKKDQQQISRLTEKLPFPLFVKPANTGSSVGIEKVKTMAELLPAIERAFQYDTKVLVEQGIDATELEVAVLESPEGDAPIASVVGEIRPNHAFYSYAAKYLDEKGADFFVPAEIDAATQINVQALAKKIFVMLECEGMARVDLFLERGTGKLWFNEINTLPGFTAISMYPRLMAASGIPYPELLSRLIDLALQRFARRKNLLRECAEGKALSETQKNDVSQSA